MLEAGFSQSLDEGEPSCFRSIAPVLKGLVKTGYNVYMTFYGSEFITVLFERPTAEGLLQDFAPLDSSVQCICSGQVGFFSSFSSLFLSLFSFYFSFQDCNSETTIVPSNCSQTGQETNVVNPQCRRQPQESFLVPVILAFSQHASHQQEYLPCAPDLPKCGGTSLCILLSSPGPGSTSLLVSTSAPHLLIYSLRQFFLTFMTLG